MGQTELNRCHVLRLRIWPDRVLSAFPWTLKSVCVSIIVGVAAVAAGVGSAQALNQDFVPAGAVGSRTRFSLDSYDRGIDRLGRTRNIQSYAIHTPPGNESVSGSLSRQAYIVDFDFSYGLSDTWNLSFGIPVGQLTQSSSLRTSGATAEVQAQVESVASDSFTELGDLRLLSLHRTTYTDWTGIIFGYGISVPPGDQHSKYIGTPTFAQRSAGADIFGLFHITGYPAVERSRIDFEMVFHLPRESTVDTPLKKNVTLVRGNGFSFELAWQQEIDALLLGTFVKYDLFAVNTLGGQNLNDAVRRWVYGLSMGYGNLTELEAGPVPFPYQLRFDFEKTIAGFNIPLQNKLSFSLTTYF